MSNNTKIFSEAIAEAKAIRETAMANAKLALEEAFAPRIQEMMSTKLEALAEEDEIEEGFGQEETQNEEISLEELLAELEGLEEGEDKDADDKKMEENTIAEAEDDDEVGTISVDELKDIIRDIMADVMGGGEEEEAGEEEMEAGEEEMEAGEDDLELEEILAEIASLEEGDDEEIEEGLKDFAKNVGDKIGKGIDKIGKGYDKLTNLELGKDNKTFNKFYDKTTAAREKFADLPGEVKGFKESEDLDEMDGGKQDRMNAFSGKNDANALDTKIANMVKSAAKKLGMSVADYYKKNIAGTPGEPMLQREEEELQEAMSTIATLRSELNEVNLLNAKLLYVNKLFKAKNLNEAQKVKVINAFDRAETVREAKNVFDTLNESLNTEKAKSQIKESLSFASKASGVSDRQPIMEGNDFVARMQKLAGII
jgi:hypothetical protein